MTGDLTPGEVTRWLQRLEDNAKSNHQELLNRLEALPFVLKAVYDTEQKSVDQRLASIETTLDNNPPARVAEIANSAKTMATWALAIFLTAVIGAIVTLVLSVASSSILGAIGLLTVAKVVIHAVRI